MDQSRRQENDSGTISRPDIKLLIHQTQRVLDTTTSESPACPSTLDTNTTTTFAPSAQTYLPYPQQTPHHHALIADGAEYISHASGDWMQPSFPPQGQDLDSELSTGIEPLAGHYHSISSTGYIAPTLLNNFNYTTPGNVGNQAGVPSGHSYSNGYSAHISSHQGYPSSVTTAPDDRSLYATSNATQTPAPGEPSKNFNCSNCQREFTSQKDLKRHILTTRKHPEQTSFDYTCSCGYKVKRKDNYLRHLRSVSGSFDPPPIGI